MDKKYVELFKELTRTTAVTAEQAMEYNEAQNDTQGLKAATTMRDDYEALHDRLEENYDLTKADTAKLLVAAMLQLNRTQGQIAALRKAATGYQTELIPKLQEIVDNASSDEEAAKMAKEKFILENNE